MTVVYATLIIFLSARPLRGATNLHLLYGVFDVISIHAPLAGRDFEIPRFRVPSSISIHAPLAGRDVLFFSHAIVDALFQSTRPLRGATARLAALPTIMSNFNPRAPRGARLDSMDTAVKRLQFQSTRPSRGATAGALLRLSRHLRFQSTRHSRGATTFPWHPPKNRGHFNPRAPRGARLVPVTVAPSAPIFQSTRPSRGATC